MATIDFRRNKEKLFASVFYKVRAAQKSGKRFHVNYGSANSSKSVSQHQSEIINLLTCDFHILFMRKVAADLYDSCYALLEQEAIKFGIYDRFKWTYSQQKREIRNKKTGKKILFRGADDISKLKSIVGVGRIILEEADAFEFTDFKELIRRARGFEGVQITFILNPVDEEHWIKTMFVDATGVYHPRTYINQSTYKDNKFALQADIDELEAMRFIDEYDYMVYALGQWGRVKTGAEFYPHFNVGKHIIPCSFDPGKPIHLTYDFNSLPYMTLLCLQYYELPDEIIVKVFREYCLKSPLNSAESVSVAFVDDHQKYLNDIFYYGDASGNNRIAGQGDKVNYDDVRKVLTRWIDDASNRVSSYNKPIMKRRKLVNTCLSGNLHLGPKKITIQIDPSCEETVKDFRYVKLGKDGKLKEEHHDKRTGQKWQKYGHCTDAFEYCFCELFDMLM